METSYTSLYNGKAKTTREAIKVMTNLVAEYGYHNSGESFSIADKNEVWIMELIGESGRKGAVWAAVRIQRQYLCVQTKQEYNKSTSTTLKIGFTPKMS